MVTANVNEDENTQTLNKKKTRSKTAKGHLNIAIISGSTFLGIKSVLTNFFHK